MKTTRSPKPYSRELFPLLIRATLAIVFLFSAIWKLKAMDDFEVYIYSLGFLNLNQSFILARLIISGEFFFAAMFLTGHYGKFTRFCTITLLTIFSAFILSRIISGDEAHCHCFGNMLELTHTQSLLKNLGLGVSVLLVWLQPGKSLPYPKFFTSASLLISLALPLVLSPPDFFRYEYYASKTTYHEEALKEFLMENNLTEGRQVLCFYGVHCRYCKLSAKKMKEVLGRSGKEELVSYVFWGDPRGIEAFLKETDAPRLKQYSMEKWPFVKITRGRMPLILLLENGEVKGKYRYRDFRDREVLAFLRGRN